MVWKQLNLAVGQLLFMENFNHEIVEKINDEYIDLEYTKTDSRSILGSMNDLMYHYEFMIYDGGGFKYCDLDAIISQVNRIPQLNTDHVYAIRAVRELLA